MNPNKKELMRHKRIIFRLTADELDTIERAAAKAERNLSDFARLTLLRALGSKKPYKRGR